MRLPCSACDFQGHHIRERENGQSCQRLYGQAWKGLVVPLSHWPKPNSMGLTSWCGGWEMSCVHRKRNYNCREANQSLTQVRGVPSTYGRSGKASCRSPLHPQGFFLLLPAELRRLISYFPALGLQLMPSLGWFSYLWTCTGFPVSPGRKRSWDFSASIILRVNSS